MIPDVVVSVQEKTDVAAARRAVLEFATLGEEAVSGLSLIVTELATNLVKHAGGGHVLARRTSRGAGSGIEVISIDKGPGIPNPGRCFEDGYSTTGTPGNGLGAISRLSSFYDYYSAPDSGTVLMARVADTAPATMGQIEVGAIAASYPGEEISGDSWAVATEGSRCRLTLADGLGHGVFASEASATAIDATRGSMSLKVEALIEKAHGMLRSTRGAAVSMADADFRAETLFFMGVGNVAGSIVAEDGKRRQMICSNGTLGHVMGRTHPGTFSLPAGSLLVMHSDGVSGSWDFQKYPGLLQHDPTVIAAVLFRDFRRDRDDATVVVARSRKTNHESSAAFPSRSI